ncbi:DDB1- and CUL4-associated factor 13 [Cichlidogyrus casuarinus]|uniref:DDB1- and CUL4-associated factor 13 n=1 Tax=Cichlidogyrus casuarinus TaxID=1844966 RepID=A0ABD2QAP0_9PLAT
MTYCCFSDSTEKVNLVMKVKVLSRNPKDYQRETIDDIHKMPKNPCETQHPLAVDREYVKALNAAKISKMMAKPFIGALEGTTEIMTVLSLNSEVLNLAVFGTADGKVQYWDIAGRKLTKEMQAHDSEVTGICHFNKASLIYTCSLDSQLKQWRMDHDHVEEAWKEPLSTIILKWSPHCLDHHRSQNQFLVGGSESCLLYNADRLDCPLQEWTWGREAIHCAKFNPVEQNVVSILTKDNSIILADSRQGSSLRKVKMNLKLNSFSWNPMEPFIFTGASDDYNLYTYDTRYFKYPRRIFRGHVNAVMDVDYSPTGTELVSGSYDGSIRLWKVDQTGACDVYHAKRMKRVLSVRYSLDSQYIFSSSSDQNVRLWKAHANDKLGVLNPRQRLALAESEALRIKYKEHPEVRRILNRKHLPKSLLVQSKELKIIHAKQKRKERNVRVHTNSQEPIVPERERHTTALYK